MRIARPALCFLLVLTLLPGLWATAAQEDFPDVAGHWAEATLRQAAADGLLTGFADGTMRPNGSLTQAQILAVLCRILGARPEAEPESLGLTGREWYADAALGASSLGLQPDLSRINAPMTRGEALALLCRALGLTRTGADRSVLHGYAEQEAPDEIVSLVALGLVQGYNGSLHLDGGISRAEFVTVLYRALGAASAVRQDSVHLTDETLEQTLWVGGACASVQLEAVSAAELVVRAQALKTLCLARQSRVERLVLTCGDRVDLRLSGGSRIGELVIAGDGCTLDLTGGTVEKLVIDGADFSLQGQGGVSETVLNTIRSQPPKQAGRLTDNRDFGIEGAQAAVTAPEVLPLEAPLEAEAVVTLPADSAGKSAKVRWYIGGQLLEEGDVVLEPEEQRFALSAPIAYSRALPGAAPVTFQLLYTGREVEQTVSAESAPVILENHDEAYYQALDEARVLALVDTGYEGDYTLAWAEANDYADGDKALWVNASGYASETEYLIWISLKYQRCNIFRGTQGAWTLIRSGIVGTGAPGNDTPVGEWKTTYKQEHGWTTGTYTVKPVVRFKGGGYAFHSRLYRPGTAILSDPSIGFPVSHGCIRMYDEDIQWIFDNIPENTTVVVF